MQARGVSAGYLGQPVIHDLTFDIVAGEVTCLLGPNGAGKTTTLRALAGALPPMSGDVLMPGAVTTAKLYQLARRGLSYVTADRSIFLSVTPT